MPPEHVIIEYGAGGAGKTSTAGTLALWIYQTYGKKTRFYFSDTSIKPLRPLIDKGIIETMQVDLWAQYPFLTLDLITKGAWPKEPSQPGSPLLPAQRQWRECPFCQKEAGGTAQVIPISCSSCKKPLAGVLAPVKSEPVNGFDKVGCLIYEGLTSFGDIMMRSMSRRLARGETIGVIEKDKTTIFQDGQGEDGKPFMIGGYTWSHYNVAQDYIQQFVANTKTLPVEVVLWTALEEQALENGKKIYAPMYPGRQVQAKCISWFTDVLHLDLVPTGRKDGGFETVERKLFLEPHFAPDDPTFPYKAKCSAPPEGGMPRVIKPDFAVFFGELKKANDKAAQFVELKKDA